MGVGHSRDATFVIPDSKWSFVTLVYVVDQVSQDFKGIENRLIGLLHTGGNLIQIVTIEAALMALDIRNTGRTHSVLRHSRVLTGEPQGQAGLIPLASYLLVLELLVLPLHKHYLTIK